MIRTATRDEIRSEVRAWLQERLDNCLRIAELACVPDRSAWIDDASYFSAAIEQITERDAALARAVAAEKRSEWQPIETATDQDAQPWDGRHVLIATNHRWTHRVHCARWTDCVHGDGIFGWAVDDCKHGPYALRGYTQVTHWMPLPPSPTGTPSPTDLRASEDR